MIRSAASTSCGAIGANKGARAASARQLVISSARASSVTFPGLLREMTLPWIRSSPP